MQGHGREARDEHDFEGLIHFGCPLGELDPVHAGHDDIGEQQVETEALETFEGLLPSPKSVTSWPAFTSAAARNRRSDLSSSANRICAMVFPVAT